MENEVCVYEFYNSGSNSHRDAGDSKKKYGYDGIEPRAQAKHKHGIEIETGPAERKEIKKYLRKVG